MEIPLISLNSTAKILKLCNGLELVELIIRECDDGCAQDDQHQQRDEKRTHGLRSHSALGHPSIAGIQLWLRRNGGRILPRLWMPVVFGFHSLFIRHPKSPLERHR
jgi:hypothetical protein